jgi:hypothetical protein
MLLTVRHCLKAPRPHEWVLLALLLFMTRHYFWLMDDAFIYFRYIDNLVFLQRGLVFNPGEYVEGFSSPLWLLLLVPLRALGIDYYTLVIGFSLACAGCFGAGLIWLNRQLSAPGPIVNFPLAACAAHYGVTSHFSSGLETPLVQLCALGYAAALVRPRVLFLQAVVALSPLVRPELAVTALLYAGWAFWRERRVPWSLLCMLALANGAWLAFRIYYYADLLPNTFYLKDLSNVQQGVFYVWNVLQAHHLLPVAAVLLAVAVFARSTLVSVAGHPRSMMLLLAAAHLVYVVRVGGDMLYYRYAAFSFCAALCASAGVCEAGLARLKLRRAPQASALAIAALVAVVFAAGYPEQLLSHPFALQSRMLRWHGIADAMWHRTHKQLRFTPGRAAEDAALRGRYARNLAAAGHPRPGAKQSVLTSGWCYRAYVTSSAYVVHSFGLTDPMLARVPAPFVRPGHKQIARHAKQLARLRKADPAPITPGAVDRWLQRKAPPRWLVRNAVALRVIERKMYNHHDWRENLTLALTRATLL